MKIPVRLLLALSLVPSLLISVNLLHVSAEDSLVLYAFIAVILIIAINRINIQSFGPLYIVLLYTIISHFGITIAGLFDPEAVIAYTQRSHKFYAEYLSMAFAIAHIGITAMIFGVLTAKQGTTTTPDNRQKRIVEHEVSISKIIVFLYTALLMWLVINDGLLTVSYAETKTILGTSIHSHMQRLFWIALIPIALHLQNKRMWLLMLMIAFCTIVLMLSGNRNDIMIPLSMCFGIYVLEQKKVPKVMLVVSLIILFTISPAIAATRQTQIDLSEMTFAFYDSFLEMGAQIRPITIVLYLMDIGEIQHMFGGTLIVPLLAVLSLGYATNWYATSLFNVRNIIAIVGLSGMAFSMVAEMWLNFGIIGMVVINFFLFRRISHAEKNRTGKLGLVLYGQVMVLFMYWVRGAMQMNYTLLVFALALYCIASILTDGRIVFYSLKKKA